MAFTKQPKLCQDAPAGVETFNRLADNLDSLRADLELEHGPLNSEDEGSPGGPGTEDELAATAGKHEHPLLPRGGAVVKQTTSDPTLISAYGVQLVNAVGCLQSMQVLDVGVYFFPITGFSKVWGKGTPNPERVSPIISGLPQDIKVQPGEQVGTGATGLVVRTFRLQENDAGHDEMLPFHCGFSLVAFGRRSTTPAPPSGIAPLRPTRWGWRPRKWTRFPGRGR